MLIAEGASLLYGDKAVAVYAKFTQRPQIYQYLVSLPITKTDIESLFGDKFLAKNKRWRKDDVNSQSLASMFSTIVIGLLICFGAYASNLKVAKEYIYSDEFFSKIKQIAKDSNN